MIKYIPLFAVLLQVGRTNAQAGAASLSPDGANFAYAVTTTDWKENRYHEGVTSFAWSPGQTHRTP